MNLIKCCKTMIFGGVGVLGMLASAPSAAQYGGPADSPFIARFKPGQGLLVDQVANISAASAETGFGTPISTIYSPGGIQPNETILAVASDSAAAANSSYRSDPFATRFEAADATSYAEFAKGAIGVVANSTSEKYALGQAYIGDYVSFTKWGLDTEYVDFKMSLHGTAYCCDTGADKFVGQGWKAIYDFDVAQQVNVRPNRAFTQYVIGTNAGYDFELEKLRYSDYIDSYTDGFQFGGWSKGGENEVVFNGRFILPSNNVRDYQTFDYLISNSLSVIASGGAALFGSTAKLSFTVSDGVTFQTRSGTFLSDTGVSSAVPEPATWAMMFVGLCMVGVTLRHRRHPTATTYA